MVPKIQNILAGTCGCLMHYVSTDTLSSCTDPIGFAEGGEYNGFAMPSPDPGAPDSYYFLLIRELPDSLSLISVIYDPT